jgi:hypothetical protein
MLNLLLRTLNNKKRKRKEKKKKRKKGKKGVTADAPIIYRHKILEELGEDIGVIC